MERQQIQIYRSYRYRLYPNKQQRIQLEKTFGCVRFYWNSLVATFRSYDPETNPNPIYQSSTDLRKEYVWMNEVSAGALQQKGRDFEMMRKQFFSKSRKSKIGIPNFKKKKNHQSFRLSNQKFRFLKDNRIWLEKIGNVKFVNSRNIPEGAKLMSATVSKVPSGQYFVSVNFELMIDPKIKHSTTNVGIDLGLTSFATLSNGIKFENSKHFMKYQKELKRAQQHLARKQRGSERYEKQRIKVAKIHQKISRKRYHELHQIANEIVRNYNEIGMEDLNVIGLLKNRNLAKHISDASWSSFKHIISYKQMEYGKEVKFLNRFEASTKQCNKCGYIQEMNLKERMFDCELCRISIDRDINAAIVIRNKLFSKMNQKCVQDGHK